MSKPNNLVDKYRLAWIERALAHPGLTHAEARVAARLGHFANMVTLECFPSVPVLAQKTGMSDERNVRRALRSLKMKGWITWEDNPGGSRRGEGISNQYKLLDTHMPPGQKNPAGAPAAYKPYRATLSPVTGLIGEQHGQNGQATLSGKAGNPVTSGEQPGHQSPSNHSNPDLNLGGDCGQAGSLTTALGGRALARPPATEQDHWSALQKHFGLEHVRLERIAGGTVYLDAPSPGEASEIEQTLGENLLSYWRLFRPSVTRVRVLSFGVDVGEAAPRHAASAP